MDSKFSPGYLLDDFFKLFPNEKRKLIIVPSIIALILSFLVNIVCRECF